MNHLEPLSWPAPLRSDGLVAHEREALLQQHLATILALSVRSTFRVIATFLEGCRQSASPAVLAGSVHAARELGRITFELAGARSLVSAPLRMDCALCLDGLERLAESQSAGESLPHWELAHALDTLIALVVQLDGAASAPSNTWAGRSLSAHSRDSRKGRDILRVRVLRLGAPASPMANPL
jgi:hypothetical protein